MYHIIILKIVSLVQLCLKKIKIKNKLSHTQLIISRFRTTEAVGPFHKYAFMSYKGTQLYMVQLHFAFLHVQTPGTDNIITYALTREW